MRVTRWTVLAPVAAGVIALTSCANVGGGGSAAPDPAKTLPAAIASLVKTDVGQYYGTPKPGTSDKDVQATVDRLQGMPGVQSAELEQDGRINLQFLGGSTPDQHDEAVRQLAAIATIDEGV